jgi:hypothetical protein
LWFYQGQYGRFDREIDFLTKMCFKILRPTQNISHGLTIRVKEIKLSHIQKVGTIQSMQKRESLGLSMT